MELFLYGALSFSTKTVEDTSPTPPWPSCAPSNFCDFSIYFGFHISDSQQSRLSIAKSINTWGESSDVRIIVGDENAKGLLTKGQFTVVEETTDMDSIQNLANGVFEPGAHGQAKTLFVNATPDGWDVATLLKDAIEKAAIQRIKGCAQSKRPITNLSIISHADKTAESSDVWLAGSGSSKIGNNYLKGANDIFSSGPVRALFHNCWGHEVRDKMLEKRSSPCQCAAIASGRERKYAGVLPDMNLSEPYGAAAMSQPNEVTRPHTLFLANIQGQSGSFKPLIKAINGETKDSEVEAAEMTDSEEMIETLLKGKPPTTTDPTLDAWKKKLEVERAKFTIKSPNDPSFISAFGDSSIPTIARVQLEISKCQRYIGVYFVLTKSHYPKVNCTNMEEFKRLKVIVDEELAQQNSQISGGPSKEFDFTSISANPTITTALAFKGNEETASLQRLFSEALDILKTPSEKIDALSYVRSSAGIAIRFARKQAEFFQTLNGIQARFATKIQELDIKLLADGYPSSIEISKMPLADIHKLYPKLDETRYTTIITEVRAYEEKLAAIGLDLENNPLKSAFELLDQKFNAHLQDDVDPFRTVVVAEMNLMRNYQDELFLLQAANQAANPEANNGNFDQDRLKDVLNFRVCETSRFL